MATLPDVTKASAACAARRSLKPHSKPASFPTPQKGDNAQCILQSGTSRAKKMFIAPHSILVRVPVVGFAALLGITGCFCSGCMIYSSPSQTCRRPLGTSERLARGPQPHRPGCEASPRHGTRDGDGRRGVAATSNSQPGARRAAGRAGGDPLKRLSL